MKIPAATINAIISENEEYKKHVELLIYVLHHAFAIKELVAREDTAIFRITVNGSVFEKQLTRQECPVVMSGYMPLAHMYLLSFLNIGAVARLVKSSILASEKIPVDTKYISDLILEVLQERCKLRLNELSEELMMRLRAIPNKQFDSINRVLVGEKFHKAKPHLEKVYRMGLTENEIISILRYFSMKNRRKI